MRTRQRKSASVGRKDNIPESGIQCEVPNDSGTDLFDGAESECEVCNLPHPTEQCPLINSGIRVLDTSLPTKAFLTLPDGLISQKHSDGIYDVISSRGLAKGTQFGPLDAPKISTFNPSCAFELRIFKGIQTQHFLDTTDLRKCNWMVLVRFTKDAARRNTICYQLKNEIYFSVVVDILPGQSLLVAYSPGYSAQLSKCDDGNTSSAGSPPGPRYSLELGGISPTVTVSNSPSRIIKVEMGKADRNNFFDHDYIAPPSLSLVSVDFIKKDETTLSRYLRTEERSPSPSHSIESNEQDVNDKSILAEAPPMKKPRYNRAHPRSDWKCKFCNLKVDSVTAFAKHLIDHYKAVGPGTDKKSICNSPDDTTKSITVIPQPYTCDICAQKRVFKRVQFIIRHLDSAHCQNYEDQKINQIACLDCTKTFESGQLLEDHTLAAHPLEMKCNKCRWYFNSRDKLKSHDCKPQKTILETISINTCSICDETFPNSGALKKHIGTHDKASFTCNTCNKILCNEDFKTHIAICDAVHRFENRSEDKLNCSWEECEESFTNSQNFKEHLTEHTHPFTCPTCNSKRRTVREKRLHRCENFVCDGCEASFQTLDMFKCHILDHHENRGTTNYCFECALPFATMDGYVKHELKQKCAFFGETGKNSQSTDRTFMCEVCGATYTNWSSMKTHKKLHGPRRFSCPVCNKAFFRKDMCVEHLAVHKDPQFSCELCGKQLKSKKSLDIHIRIHNGIKPFSCPDCERTFTQKINLISHQRTHADQKKTFTCEYDSCAKKFSTKEYMKLHLESHQSERSYTCDVCGMQVLRAHILRKHKQTAHGNERFKCEFCNPPQMFRQKHSLYRHLSRQHVASKEMWNIEGYIDTMRIPGDGTYSHLQARTPKDRKEKTKRTLKNSTASKAQRDQLKPPKSKKTAKNSTTRKCKQPLSAEEIELPDDSTNSMSMSQEVEIETTEVVVGEDGNECAIEMQLGDASQMQNLESKNMVLLQIEDDGSGSGPYMIAISDQLS